MMDLENLEDIVTQFLQGDRNEYDKFLVKLKSYSSPMSTGYVVDDAVLVSYLKQLGKCATLLNRRCSDLVFIILKIDWLSKDKTTLNEFHNFVCELVSAQTFYFLQNVLEAFASYFRPKDPNSTVLDKMEITNEHKIAFSQLHCTLLAVLKAVPSSRPLLCEVLCKRCPHIEVTPTYSQLAYVSNVLKLTLHPTEILSQKLRRELIQLVVSHLIKLDALIARDDLLESEDLIGAENQISKGTTSTQKHAKTLDVLMTNLFNYIVEQCFHDGTFDLSSGKKLYLDLLAAFDLLLLRTQKSCHVQFLLFYICSLSKTFAEGFVNFLWEKLENPATEPIYRQLAAMYVASFLARAKYVSISGIKNRMLKMKEWIDRYIALSYDFGVDPTPVHHGPFYSVCQALFYLFTFRHKELLDTEKGRQFCKNLNFQRIVASDLNPLRFCRPLIAVGFSAVVRNNYIAMCDTILEKNRRCFIPELTDSSSHFSSLVFPFEPYLLPQSSFYIAPIFQEYIYPEIFETAPAHNTVEAEEMSFMDIDDEEHEFLALNPVSSCNIESLSSIG